jgi:ferritin
MQSLESKIIDLLNYRIEQEEMSSRIYKQMALWLNNKGFVNFSKLYEQYAKEELEHANWAKQYLLAYGIEPKLRPLPSPEMEINTLKDILVLTLEHEKEITEQCNELAKECQFYNCYTCFDLALKYCKEQVEELEKAQTLVDKINLFGESPESLFLFEHDIEHYLN